MRAECQGVRSEKGVVRTIYQRDRIRRRKPLESMKSTVMVVVVVVIVVAVVEVCSNCTRVTVVVRVDSVGG